MKRPVGIRYGWAVLLLSLTLFSCSEYGNELQFTREGKIHVQITDAPFPTDLIQTASITVTRIEARLKDSEESGEDPFVLLFEGSESVDLMELTNGVTRSMGVAGVPSGSYDLIRVYVSEAWVTTPEAEQYRVKVPSGSSSGIKVFVRPAITVEEETTADLLLDFDLSKSFVLRGNPEKGRVNGLLFKPVVRAANLGYAGRISGTVTTHGAEEDLALEGAQVSLIAADTVYASALTDAAGGYEIPGILPGEYMVQAEKQGFMPSEQRPISIAAEEILTQDFQLLPEE